MFFSPTILSGPPRTVKVSPRRVGVSESCRQSTPKVNDSFRGVDSCWDDPVEQRWWWWWWRWCRGPQACPRFSHLIWFEQRQRPPNTADPKQHRTPPEHHTPPRVLLKTPLSVCLSVRLNRKCFRVLNLRQVSDQWQTVRRSCARFL